MAQTFIACSICSSAFRTILDLQQDQMDPEMSMITRRTEPGSVVSELNRVDLQPRAGYACLHIFNIRRDEKHLMPPVPAGILTLPAAYLPGASYRADDHHQVDDVYVLFHVHN